MGAMKNGGGLDSSHGSKVEMNSLSAILSPDSTQVNEPVWLDIRSNFEH